MMKKMMTLILALLLCLGAAICLADDYGTGVVWGKNSTKVHLREEATSDSDSLGLFFTGTEVELRSNPDKKWVKVRMGGLSGYMSSSYLRTDSGREKTEKKFQSGIVTAKNYAYFRNGPSTEYMVIDRIDQGEQVIIMGETKEHWYYIQYGKARGYISGNLVRITGDASYVPDNDIAYEPNYRDPAFVNPGFREPDRNEPSAGRYDAPGFVHSGSMPRSLPMQWIHTSGAGGWATEMTLDANGFFYGYFHDSEADRVYESSFSGLFTDVRKRDAYSYTMKLSGFHVFGTMGEAQARNGALYITQEPAGLEKGAEYVLYLPGTPMNKLSQEERIWALDSTGSTLRSYLLCCRKTGRGFIPNGR